jgi:hypothetical protein
VGLVSAAQWDGQDEYLWMAEHVLEGRYGVWTVLST